MFKNDLEALENTRREADLARERGLTDTEKSQYATNLILDAKQVLWSAAEVITAVQTAFWSTGIDKEDLAKGKVTFRRGGHIWELITRSEISPASAGDELILTKLPPMEETDPADLQEEARIIITHILGEPDEIGIQYNHLFANGKNPIIHTNTNLAVEYGFRFLNDFRNCTRRSL